LYPWDWPATTGWNSRHDYGTIHPAKFEIEQDTILMLDIYIDRYVDIKTHSFSVEKSGLLFDQLDACR
jgi:hypothetical protein